MRPRLPGSRALLGQSVAVLARLAAAIARRPWRVLALWALVVLGCALPALGVVGEGLFARLTSGAVTVPGPAREGSDRLEAEDPRGPSVLLQLERVDPEGAEAQQALGDLTADLAALDGVAEVTAPLLGAPGAPPGAAEALIGEDGSSALVTAVLADGLGAARETEVLDAVAERLRAVEGELPGSSARVESLADLDEVFSEQVERDLRTGEAVALPISLAVMVVVFGGFLAAGIPLLGALVSIAGGLGALLGFSYLTDVDASIVNVVTVLGLGLCIDYGLLVVSRYREELRVVAALLDADPGASGRGAAATVTAREQRAAALVRTLSTAGRTVIFSAVTIGISLCGLLVFSADILRSMGLAAASVVLVALLVALTLVPALLAIGGARLTRPGAATRVPGLRVLARSLGDVAPEEGAFSALARRVQRHPWLVIAAVVAVLGVAATPVLGITLRSDDVELLPADNPSRVFFTDLEDRFPAASAPTVTVVADAAPDQVADHLAGLDLADAAVEPPVEVGDLVTVAVRADPAGGEDDAAVEPQEERALLAALRAEPPPFPAWTTGPAAATQDFLDDLTRRAPLAVGLVVVATFVLLFLMTGSVLVPVKALLANLLSLGACLGVITWIFQDGHLEGLLGFTSAGGVESFVAPLALAFGFGLAMDYEVFLLARILDARSAGASTDLAVVQGLQRSGRIITSAALIVVIVFAGFVTGGLLAIKQVGLALAVAVAIDATLVRMLLVPATMTVLGEHNWWAPRALRRLHDRFGISEHGPAAAPATGPDGTAVPPPVLVPALRGRHRA